MKEAPLVRNPELGSNDDDAEYRSGRGSGRNGRGNGGLRDDMPFDAPRHSYWKTFWKSLLVFLFVASAGVFGYVKFTKSGREAAQIFGEVGPAVFAAKMNPGLIFDHNHSDVVNILLIGRDVNWTIKKVYDPTRKIWARMQVHDEDTPARSDTMIVVSLNRTRNEINMISLPRDARVQMPPNKFDVHRAKLNAAHAYGGPEMLIQTIHDELGLTIHRHAVIRFEGFKELIDQVGGVQVDVIGALHRDGTRGPLKYDDNWGNLHINLKPGKQILDGEKAHSYVRFRMDIEGDPGRIKRQQQVMRALAKSMMTQRIDRIPGLVQEVRKQFKTDMTNEEIASAADFAKNIGDPSKIQPLTMFGVFGSRGSLILNKPKNAKLFHYIFGPTFDETRFLENSPWTRRDEMGEENNSSPGAKAVLQKAGLIKGAPAAAQGEVSSGESSSVNNSSGSRLAVAEDSGDTVAAPGIRTNDERSSARSTASQSEERPRRRTRRRNESSDSQSTPRNTPRVRESRSAPRSQTELSVPSDELRSSDEAPARTSSESPVPRAESERTLSVDESPVPRAE